jgi:hypothetical protein
LERSFTEDVWQDISDRLIWEFILGATGMAYCAGTRDGCGFGFAEDVWQDISDWSIWEFILGATAMAYCAGTREGLTS